MSAADPLLGERIGHYRLVRELGRGGMGVVYEVVHEGIGQRAAVKVLQSAKGERAHDRFLDEARAASAVRHEGLVKIFDFGQLDDGTAWLLMELLEGETLRRRIARRRSQGGMVLDEALRVVRQVASAVAAAHERGIVHRDLKPENVMLIADGEAPGGERAKVLDFGLAKFLDAPSARTEEGVVLGTAVYMSPEQCSGQRVSDRCDVYALGVMLHELIGGEAPFTGTRSEVLHRHLFEEPRSLAEQPGVPEEVTALAKSMLQKAAPMRPAMKDVEEELRRLERAPATGDRTSSPGEMSLTTEAAGPAARVLAPPGLPEPRRRRWRALVAAAALPLVAGGAIAISASIGRPRGAGAGRPTAESAVPGMALIPGGRFDMGSSPSEIDAADGWCRSLLGDDPCVRSLYEREQPLHEVTLSPFHLDLTEVTNQQFVDWLNRLTDIHLVTGQEEPVLADRDGWLIDTYPRYGVSGVVWQSTRIGVRSGYEHKPVNQVTWSAASRYCAAQGKRLPTEAEWERAARASGQGRFPWGDEEPRCDGVVFARWPGGACAGSGTGTTPVGAAPRDRSPEGIFDLAGSVAEWTEDRFQLRYPPCPPPCRDPVVKDNTEADGGPEMHVVRGGSFGEAAEACRSAGRGRRKDREVKGEIGFRCARSFPQPPPSL